MMARKPWWTLPPVSNRAGIPMDRVPDEVLPDGTYRRMVQCGRCGQVIPSLGVGYHVQGKTPCDQRPPRQDNSKHSTFSEHRRKLEAAARPVYGPPEPTPEMLEDHARQLAWEAHCALPTSECEHATTPAGCWVHPADIAQGR